jgi:hypothetical protein
MSPSCTLIRLPSTCPLNRRSYAHVKLLMSVHPQAWNATGFEGTLHRPGARLTPEDLGDHPVALECAGPQGKAYRGKPRLTLWILWRYDWGERDWREIARATAENWAWAVTLRDPAIRALQPTLSHNRDNAERGREVTDELLRWIDSALLVELPEVRALVLTAIYDQMAGRIVLGA